MKYTIEEISLQNKTTLKKFIKLEIDLLGSEHFFVSDILSDIEFRIQGKSKYLTDAKAAYYIVKKGPISVARCMALLNNNYCKDKHENIGFIGYFAAAPDCQEEVSSMLHKAESQLSAWGASRVIAPYNGSPFWGFGLLTKSYDRESKVMYGWNPPYYPDYFLKAGYSPTYPLWSYTVNFETEKYKYARQTAVKNDAVEIRTLKQMNFRQGLEIIRDIVNISFEDDWTCGRFTVDSLYETLHRLKPILDFRQILVAFVDGKPAGVCIGMPIYNRMLKSIKGDLGGLNRIKLVIKSRMQWEAGLCIIAVLPEARARMVGTKMAISLYEFYRKRGLKEAGYYFVNDSNVMSRKFVEKLGGEGDILHYAYDKSIMHGVQ